MKRYLTILASVCLLASCCNAGKDVQHLQKAADFGRIDDQIQLYLQDLRACSGTAELNSIMVLKDGKVLLEHYDNCYGPDFRNICWSASKTFTATAVGFAVQDGLLSIEDKVVDFLEPEMLPENVSDTLAGLTIYNLLRMSSGFSKDLIADAGSKRCTTPTRSTLEAGFKFAPGEKYAYNSMNTYLLSVIVTKVTGKLVKDYLKEKLFEPLGIRNYYWDESTEGYDMGGWGLYITTEALAKMGQFYLQKGSWNGKQLLNPEWIEQAMTPQIYQKGEPVEGDDKALGYGYQMWMGNYGTARLDGAHGQWSIICPEKNAVIVITQHTNGSTTKMWPAVWRLYNAI